MLPLDALLAILGAFFVLVLGSFSYTFKVHMLVLRLWRNHFAHLQDDVEQLRKRMDRQDNRMDRMDHRA
jgi:hypothetical protein